jgi:PAS domain S-box-containing protein
MNPQQSVARSAVFEEMRDAIVILDGDYRIIDLNQAASRILNRQAKDALGHSIEEWCSPLHQVLTGQSGDSGQLIERLFMIDGTNRFFEVHVSRLANTNGSMNGWAVTLVNTGKPKSRTNELSFLLEASQALNSTLDLEELLHMIAQQMLKVAGVDGCTLSRWDKESGNIVTWIEERTADSSRADAPGQTYNLDDFPQTAAVLTIQRPLVIRAGDSDADEAERRLMLEQGTCSVLMLPLVVEGQSIGLVELDSETERGFSPQEIKLCQALAGQAAIAIEKARLHADTEKKLRAQSALRRASEALSSSLGLQDVLTRIAEQMARAAACTSAYVLKYDHSTNIATVIAEYITDEASQKERVSDLGVSYHEDDPRYIDILHKGHHYIEHVDGPNLGEEDRQHFLDYDAKTVLYIPLQAKGIPIGYVELWESREIREFDADTISLCFNISRQAAAALDNATLYEQLQEKNRFLQRAEQTLRESLDEKETLLKEIHHRVKNNLQIVSSLLNLQANRSSSAEIATNFKDAQNRIRAMSLVHEHLYEAGDLSSIYFSDYLKNLVTSIHDAFGTIAHNVHIDVECDVRMVDVDTAIPCGLIVSELVSNALKYAFQDGRDGYIRVTFTSIEDKLSLRVKDNGPGLPSELNIRESLGLQLVETLARQLGGSVDYDCRYGADIHVNFQGDK